jgi:regulator of protease activity HflC (stomatin/prohibitin superfamily)
MSLGTVIVGGAIALGITATGLKLDREYQRGVIFRLGRSRAVRGPGLYWTMPLIDQVVQVDIRTRTVSVEPQETVTADSVTIKVSAVLYYRILDPNKAINKVEDYKLAVYQGAMTTLRNVVGQTALDDVLQNRDQINQKVQDIVDEITEPWGIVIERVEMKDVEIPIAMQRAMAKEAEAQREKRARVIKAAAEKEASIQLADAAQNISAHPMALELRRLQMLTEVGAENNTTTVVMIPSELITMAGRIGAPAEVALGATLTQFSQPAKELPEPIAHQELPAPAEELPEPVGHSLAALSDSQREPEEKWEL